VDNLSLGAGFTTWVGDKPAINRFTVPVTYYIPLEYSIRPYVGVFASYTFLGDDGAIKYDDYSSFGARAGVAMDVSANMYAYAGWVQIKHNGDNLLDNSTGYPEFGVGVSF
jgi:outer membrane protein W